jgi:hypothetical protein
MLQVKVERVRMTSTSQQARQSHLLKNFNSLSRIPEQLVDSCLMSSKMRKCQRSLLLLVRMFSTSLALDPAVGLSLVEKSHIRLQ